MTPLSRAGNVRGMSTYDESLKITCELLRRHVDVGREIKPADHIQHDLGLDSLGMMELVSNVEARFGVSVPAELFEGMATAEHLPPAATPLRPPSPSPFLE